jgi:hypothetical protein
LNRIRNTVRSPKWLFIDEKNRPTTDFAEISNKLKENLGSKKVVQRSWNEVNADSEVRKIVRKLRQQEIALLPWKKRRALQVGEKILKQLYGRSGTNLVKKAKLNKLLCIFQIEPETEDYIDFDHFANLWLTILIPALDNLKKTRQRKRKIHTLNDLNDKNVQLSEEQIDWLTINCQYSHTLDEMIASCIIGISKNS